MLNAAAYAESGLWLYTIPIPSVGTVWTSYCYRSEGEENRLSSAHVQMWCVRWISSAFLPIQRWPLSSIFYDVVKRALQSVRLPSLLEPVGLGRGDRKCPEAMTEVWYGMLR